MSDVVATILLLALTVVLFSAIFAFVTSFPSPPAQNSNQFQAQIIQTPNASNAANPEMALAVSILHLAGPVVPSSALIYLKSSVYPLGPEFATPYTLAQGGITSSVWSLGQTWYLTAFTGTCSTNPGNICNPILPDNLTVYIVSGSALLFSAIIPGAVSNTPPTYLSVGTSPNVVAVGEAFTVSAVIQGVTSTNTVKITMTGLPGSVFTNMPAQSMNYSAATGSWSTAIHAGATNKSGNYYVFITASSTSGKTGTTSVPVAITSYSTLIATALSVGTGSYAKCTAAKTPNAACQASGDYSYSVTISSSSVTLGSVLFEVYTTSTGTALATTGYSAFAIALTTSATTPVVTWAGPATGPLLVSTSTWKVTYASGSSTSPLTTSYVFSVDVGTTQPSTSASTLSFIVLGTGAYSGQTGALALPAA